MPTKNRTVSYLNSLTNYQKVDSGSETLVSQSGSLTITQSSFTGTSNPLYRTLIKQKKNATTIASGELREYTNATNHATLRFRNGAQVVTRRSSGNFSTDYLYEPAITDSSMDSKVSNTALSRFLRNCLGKQRQFQSGVFLGELRETIQLIRHPLRGIRDSLDTLVYRFRQRKGLHKTIHQRDLANQWLEYSFGILPLISDVEDGVRALQRLHRKRYVCSVVGAFSDSKMLASSSFGAGNYAGSFLVDRHQSLTVSRRIKGQVYCQSNGDSTEIRQSLGLTFRDFVPTVYELIPYSFLVDYFTNLGEIIESWSFCQGDLAWYSDTTKRIGALNVNLIPVTPTTIFGLPVEYYSMAPSSSFYRYSSFVRRADPLGLPSFGFRLPGTSTKFLNIAALASLRVL